MLDTVSPLYWKPNSWCALLVSIMLAFIRISIAILLGSSLFAQIRVVDWAGEPVPNAYLRLIDPVGRTWRGRLGPTSETGALNGYMADGTYAFHVWRTGFGFARVENVQVLGGVPQGLSEVVLKPGCELSGRLLDGAGKPLIGVLLVARGDRLRRENETQEDGYFWVRRGPNVLPSGLDLSVTKTDENGDFVFRALAPGAYEVFREKPEALLTREPIQAPATGAVLRNERHRVHLQIETSATPGPAIPPVDQMYQVYFEMGDWWVRGRSDFEGEYWHPIKGRALRFWSLDGLPNPDSRQGSTSLYVNAGRNVRIAVLDPKRGVTFADIHTGAGSEDLNCMIPQGLPAKSGRIDFDLEMPPSKPKPWAVRTQVWHVGSGAYLGRVLWETGERPCIELPAGDYRIRIDTVLHEPAAGAFVGPGSDADGFESEDSYWHTGGCAVEPEDRYLFVRPGIFSAVVHVDPGSSQVIEAALAPEGRVKVALGSRLPAGSSGLEPRVHLSACRPGESEWTPLLYLRASWKRSNQDQDWIRAGMTRAADNQLAPGIWHVRAQCDDGSSALRSVKVIAGEVTLLSMTLL